MIKCSECGYENMDGLDYCDGCGAKLTVEPQGAAAASAAAATAAAATAASAQAPVLESAPTEEAVAPASQEKTGPPASDVPTGEIKAETASAPQGAAQEATAGEAPRFKAKLSIIRGGRKGQEFELESGNNLIGRWDPDTGAFPEVDLDQDDPEAKISRRHALIRIDGNKITIEDIGSLNGTFVNRQPRLAPGNPLELKSGDEIIIGKTFLKLVVDPIS